MAPSVAPSIADRLYNTLSSRQLLHLYHRLFPGVYTPEAQSPGDRISRDRALAADIADAVRMRGLTERDLLDMLAPDPLPGAILSVQGSPHPGEVTTGEMMPGPPRNRPTLELTPELWSALGRLLNPANLQEEFASAILRGDMELARVLFDRLQDEGLTT